MQNIKFFVDRCYLDIISVCLIRFCLLILFAKIDIKTSLLSYFTFKMSDVLTLETIKEINKISSEYEKTLDKLIKPQTRMILLLGPTGSGKTTIATLLMNKQLNITKYRSNDGYDEIVLDLPGSGIGHTNKAETQFPQIHAFGSDLVICDCPGFEDTEGEKEEILHSLELWKLLQKNKNNNKIQILIVASDENMRNERGNYLKSKIWNRVENIFKGTSLKGSIGLVITKCYHKKLSENNYKSEPFILRTFGENNIYLFPCPKDDEQQYSVKHTDFEKLNQFINDETRYLNNPNIHLDFNPSSKLMLEHSTQIQIKTNEGLLDDISDILIEDLQRNFNECEGNSSLFEETIRVIQDKINQLETIQNSTIDTKDTKCFVSEFRNKFSNNKPLEDCLLSLEETSSFSSFIEIIMNTNDISDAFQEKKSDTLEYIINQFKQRLQILIKDKQHFNQMNDLREQVSTSTKKIEEQQVKFTKEIEKLHRDVEKSRHQMDEISKPRDSENDNFYKFCTVTVQTTADVVKYGIDRFTKANRP